MRLSGRSEHPAHIPRGEAPTPPRENEAEDGSFEEDDGNLDVEEVAVRVEGAATARHAMATALEEVKTLLSSGCNALSRCALAGMYWRHV
jgi:hypothetical protein